MKTDLKEGISIRIEGELGKFNTLPIDSLIRIATNLQNLITKIATHNLSTDSAIDIQNFKIELTAFSKGSAIPSFIFTPRLQQTISEDVIAQRDSVQSEFEELMRISNDSDFMQLKNLFPLPIVRNEMVEGLYNFTNSFGDSPASIVSVSKSGEINPIFKINKLRPSIKEQLIVKIGKMATEEIQEEEGVASILIKRKGGKETSKIIDTYRSTVVNLSHKLNKIEFKGTTFNLYSPIFCTLNKEDGYFLLRNDLLDISASGLTIKDAEYEFSENFYYCYYRFNDLSDEKLSSNLVRVKAIINILVSSISSNNGSTKPS